MIPKEHRLSKSADVKQTTARGRSFFNPFFVIKALQSPGAPKITVIVSTKVSKKAVVRNRIKRVVREIVRVHISQFKAGSYAFILKPKSATIPSAHLREEVYNTLIAGKLLTK